MRDIIIEGPARTQGIIRPGGNKNAALPIIAAAMLTDEQVVLHNLPNIIDADAMLNLAPVRKNIFNFEIRCHFRFACLRLFYR